MVWEFLDLRILFGEPHSSCPDIITSSQPGREGCGIWKILAVSFLTHSPTLMPEQDFQNHLPDVWVTHSPVCWVLPNLSCSEPSSVRPVFLVPSPSGCHCALFPNLGHTPLHFTHRTNTRDTNARCPVPQAHWQAWEGGLTQLRVSGSPTCLSHLQVQGRMAHSLHPGARNTAPLEFFHDSHSGEIGGRGLGLWGLDLPL